MANEQHHCRALLASLSDYIDGTLDETLCEQLEKHLKDCSNCKIIVDTMRKTMELYRNEEDESLPDDVRTRLYARLDLHDFLKE